MILSRYRYRPVTVFGPPLPFFVQRYHTVTLPLPYRYLTVTLPLLTVTHRYDRFFRKFNNFFTSLFFYFFYCSNNTVSKHFY
jgi:hypothetical protein